jgi:hypothetical protein
MLDAGYWFLATRHRALGTSSSLFAIRRLQFIARTSFICHPESNFPHFSENNDIYYEPIREDAYSMTSRMLGAWNLDPITLYLLPLSLCA